MNLLQTIGRSAARKLMAHPILRSGLRRITLNGQAPRQLWRRMPVEATFFVSCDETSGFLYRSTVGDAIGRALHWRGLSDWEAETIRIMVPLFREGGTFVDIGANTGPYTLLACAINPHISVVSFEPVPRIRDALSENVSLNGWSARVEIRPEAVGDQVGTSMFHIPHASVPTSASLNPEGFRGIPGELVEVPLTTIDTVTTGRTVDIVKIDVEGFEDGVLRGMTRILTKDRPAIVVECNPGGPHAEVERVLARHGYSFFHLSRHRAYSAAHIDPERHIESRNVLCVPEEKGHVAALLNAQAAPGPGG